MNHQGLARHAIGAVLLLLLAACGSTPPKGELQTPQGRLDILEIEQTARGRRVPLFDFT